MSKKIYSNSPILEAVCEFRLPSDTEWDMTIPGQLFESLKSEYPHKEQRQMQEIKVNVALEKEKSSQEIITTERLLFRSEDKIRLVQVSPNFLAVNVLKPYPNWEEFRPQILQALEQLSKLIRINEFESVQLQYVNRIEIPNDVTVLSKFFNIHPSFGTPLGHNVTNFGIFSGFKMHEERDNCNIQLYRQVSPSPTLEAVLLVLIYSLAKPKTVDFSSAGEWIEEAHTQINQMFESCITDKLREKLY